MTNLAEFVLQDSDLPCILLLENVIHKGSLSGLLWEEGNRPRGGKKKRKEDETELENASEISQTSFMHGTMLELTPRKPVTTVIGVRSESEADIFSCI